MRDILDYTIVGLLFGLAYFFVISSDTEPEPEVEEIPTVIVRIIDDNNVIHRKEGMLLDGEVFIHLGKK
jgi:hypothetical protein